MSDIARVIQNTPKSDIPEWEKTVDALLELNEKDKPTVHQDVIVRHFIAPMASKNLNDAEQSAKVNELVTRNWIGVAGHVSRAINVADSNGNIVGTLPPLVCPIDTQIVTDEKKMLSTITSEAQKNAVLHPSLGEQYLLKGIADRGFKSTTLLKTMLDWNGLAEKLNAPIPFQDLHSLTKNIVEEKSKLNAVKETVLISDPDQDELI